MKILYFIFFIMFFAQPSIAQKDTLYYTKDGKQTTRQYAQLYRFATKQANGTYNIKGYSLEGSLIDTGTLSSLDTPFKKYREGAFSYYTANQLFSTGAFEKGKRNGKWTFYYRGTNYIKSEVYFKDDSLDGTAIYFDSLTHKIKMTGYYKNGKKEGEWQAFNKAGMVLITEQYKDSGTRASTVLYNHTGKKIAEGDFINKKFSGPWKEYDSVGNLKWEKNYVSNVKDGEATEYYANGKIERKELYSFGKLLSGKEYDENGNEINYVPAIEKAKADYDVTEYIKTHLQYPEKAKRRNIEGKVLVSFIVNEDGSISDAKILKGVGGGCDEEALRIVNHMPAWKPGMQDGKPVRFSYRLPINFVLKEN
jgi:TonB family protein